MNASPKQVQPLKHLFLNLPQSLFIASILINNLLQAQEIVIPSDPLLLIDVLESSGINLIDPQEADRITKEMTKSVGPLKEGEWTTIDRIYWTTRYQDAMLYVVTKNKASLFGKNLEQIGYYYAYLARHPLVIKNNIKWPAIASQTVLLMISAGNLRAVVSDFLSDLRNGPNLSEVARNFLNGTASSIVVVDVTEKVFGPLFRSEIEVHDPFLFDAETLYNEQFNPQILNYYDQFTAYDQSFITNSFSAKLYAAEDWELTQYVDLMVPEERVYWGLLKMGYPEDKILDYLESKSK